LFWRRAVAAQEVVAPTRPGVTVVLHRQPTAKSAGDSNIVCRFRRLDSVTSRKGQIKFGQNNFLVRSRAILLSAGGYYPDAPSDYQTGWGW
jgi:hypothetical protein